MKVSLLLTFICLGQFCLGQNLVYQKFDIDDELPSVEFYHGISMEDGTYWFVCDRGIVQYNGSQFTSYGLEDGLSDLVNLDIIKWTENKFILSGMKGGLTVWENGSFKPFEFNDSLSSILNVGWWVALHYIEDDILYFMTQNQSSKSFSIDLSSGLVKQLDNVIAFKTVVGNDKIGIDENRKYAYLVKGLRSKKRRIFAKDNIGLFWQNNIFIKTNFKTQQSIKYETPKINFIDIIGDNYWVSTVNGLYKFSLKSQDLAPEIYFKEKSISSVIKTPGNGIWVLSNEGILLVPNIKMSSGVIDFQREFESIYPFKDKLIAIENSNVHVISEDRTEIIPGVFLNPFNFANLDSAHTKLFEWNQDMYNRKYNFFLKDKKIELGTNVISVLSKDSVKILSNTRNIKLLEFKKDELFLSTTTDFYKFYVENDKVKIKLMDENLEWGTSYVKDMVKVDGGLLLGVNGKGLYSFKNDAFKMLFHPEIENIVINNIYLENDSTVWIASNIGLKKLTLSFSANDHPSIESLQSFTKNHGLNTNLINDIGLWKNRYYIATAGGLLSINKNDFRLHENSPNVMLESFRINNNAFVIDSVHLLQGLNNDQNDISLNFKSSSFFPPNNKDGFKFCLYKENQEKKWTFTNNNSLQFANLGSGNYQFEIAARTQNDLWSEHLIIPIYIKPHYTESIWFWALTILLLGFLLWLMSRYYYSQKNERVALEYQILKAEMETLRSQMNPHFIFNALNSMQGFIFGEDKKNASRFLHKFATLIRNSLNYSKSEFITLNDELDFIKTYLEIENIRFDNQFTFSFEDNGVDKLQLKVPPLMVQPLVENSIKHGFLNLKERGQIRIECIQKEDILEIIVSDNGLGIKEGDALKKESFGLQNIKKRLMLLGRNKPQMYKMKINENLKPPWKTTIKIELPILI